MSPRTLLAYKHAWANFERWCASVGRCPLPALEDSVSLFVTWSLEKKGSRLETVKLALTAIKWRHREAGLLHPVSAAVRALVRNAARERCEEPGGKRAITPQQVRSICRMLRHPSPLETRDRALLLVGFASGCRRSELAAFRLSDVAFVDDRGVTLRVRRSKTDQSGRGRVVGLPFGSSTVTCPVRALEEWLKVRGDWPGPLFCRFLPDGEMQRAPVRPEAVNVAIKRLLERAGVDPARYGAHSLRAGLATAAAERGASESSIMRRAGWKSIATVLRYVRPAQAFCADPLAGVL